MNRVLIVGSTGTLGTELVRQLLSKDDNFAIHCLSRCELKQIEQSKQFNNKRLRYHLGDIRDREQVNFLLSEFNFDIIFHTAALKHVDVLEFNPLQAIETNLKGTINLLDAYRYGRFVFFTTDKAVKPINAYGMSKALAEKAVDYYDQMRMNVHYQIFRWGNILFSRGSVLKKFKEDLINKKPIQITDPEMTRFWIRIEDAVNFVLMQIKNPEVHFELIYPNLKSCGILDIVNAIADLLGVVSWEFQVVGLRPGEKIHEDMTYELTSENAPRFTHEELKDLIRPYLGEL